MSGSEPSSDDTDFDASFPDFEADRAELEEEGRLILSPTSIISYMNDPARYYFRKVRRMKEPGSPQTFEGRAYHAGIEFSLQHKVVNNKLPELPDLYTFLEKAWDDECKAIDPALVPNPARLAYVKNVFLTLLYDRMATIDPKYMEHYVRLDLPGKDYSLHGYLDLVDSSNRHASAGFNPVTDVLTDFKSRASSPPKDAQGNPMITNFDRLQLTIYAYILSQGQFDVTGRIVYIVKTKVPKVLEATTRITVQEQLARIRTVDQIAASIKAGVFTPNYGSWMCSTEKCFFWQVCHDTL